jgi:hypothetical protein
LSLPSEAPFQEEKDSEVEKYDRRYSKSGTVPGYETRTKSGGISTKETL